MFKCDSEFAAHQLALEITKKAIENNLIHSKTSGNETAKQVIDFYKTIAESFYQKD